MPRLVLPGTAQQPAIPVNLMADPAQIATSRHLLTQLGVTLADLQTTSDVHRTPTLADYLPGVRATAGPGATRTYSTYRDRMLTRLGRPPTGRDRGQ